MTASKAEKVAAVVQLQRQNVQHQSVLLRVLRDCYFAHRRPPPSLTYLATAIAIACVAAVPILGLHSPGNG